ncbi:MAG: tetratricopeptide repeat protein [Acidobacteria bacterium]|nr:tetratricopeptide repeat protein [Acidobacteriota bacterium]
MIRIAIVAAFCFAICLYGQSKEGDVANAAYAHLNAGRLLEARQSFEASLAADPRQLEVRLDYAYLLLKLGETESGRDELKRVLAQKPDDERLMLEYAYLAFETGKRPEAFELFIRLKLAKDESIRSQAASTFARLDSELKLSIERWREAAAKSPDSYSVHEELARLLEERNAWVEAAAEYRIAFGLKPDKRRFLLDIARVELEAVRPDYASAAIIAASRGTPAMVAEEAREFLPARYPYVYEFELAIQMDPLNVALRRELGFLLLKMNREREAVAVFEALLKLAPDDALAIAQLAFLRVNRPAAPPVDNGLTAVKELADKSFERGYLKDALKYLEQLHESNPDDAATTLRLGWTYNMLKLDRDAVRCFDTARRSTDSKIAAEADQAYRSLSPSLAPVRTTVWMLPFYSSRWREGFAYSQIKAEFRLPFTKLRPYLSTRFIGDMNFNSGLLRGPAGQVTPGGLSENAVVTAVGVATPRSHNLMAWGEAGGSWQYFAQRNGTATIRSDFRGGVNFARGFGAANFSSEGGWFAVTTADAVYLSRFNNNTLFYSQNRVGYHPDGSALQFYINLNLTTDVQRMDWANYFEIGPGVRWQAPGLPRSLYLFADFIYGRHMLKGDPSRARKFTDFRAGVWYAFTR